MYSRRSTDAHRKNILRTMENDDKICRWIDVLEEVAEVYAGKTIDNIIQQLKSIRKEAEK